MTLRLVSDGAMGAVDITALMGMEGIRYAVSDQMTEAHGPTADDVAEAITAFTVVPEARGRTVSFFATVKADQASVSPASGREAMSRTVYRDHLERISLRMLSVADRLDAAARVLAQLATSDDPAAALLKGSAAALVVDAGTVCTDVVGYLDWVHEAARKLPGSLRDSRPMFADVMRWFRGQSLTPQFGPVIKLARQAGSEPATRFADAAQAVVDLAREADIGVAADRRWIERELGPFLEPRTRRPPAPSVNAERVRRIRERQSLGIERVPVEVREWDLAVLRRLGFLAEGESRSTEIASAVEAFIGLALLKAEDDASFSGDLSVSGGSSETGEMSG